MAKYIIYFIENPDIVKEMGNKNRENIKANYSMKNHLKKIEDSFLF